MSNRLSPERIAAHKNAFEHRATTDWDTDSVVIGELLGHIEAIEAELADQKASERASTDEFQMVLRVTMKELAEAKAEIARLKERRGGDADELIDWLEREAPELYARCKAALEKP